MKNGCITFPQFLQIRSGCIAACMLVSLLLCSRESNAQVVWSNAVGQSWLTGANWSGGIVPNATDTAQFGAAPTSGVTGIGINMSLGTNNGPNNQAVGAIEVTSARAVNLIIGNSSLSTNGTLTLNGTTVNAVNNVILRNNSPGLFIIQDTQGFAGIRTMMVALANSTDNMINIDGTGGITISAVISGANKKLTLAGAGTATLSLTAANTYTGLTTVSADTLQLNKTGGGTLPATNNILINGTGTFRVSSDQTIGNLTMSSGALMIDAGAKLTITGAYNVTGGTINNAGKIKLNGGAITFPGTGVTINNGTSGTMTSLEIAATGNITQNAPFTISDELTFTSGVLISGPIDHITLDVASIVSGVTNSSFVDGPISKIGNLPFTFPVGKRNCGPLNNVYGNAAIAISNFVGGAPTDKYTAEYFRGNALSLGGITAPGLHHVSSCDYWVLDREVGTSTVDITLYWDDPINNCSTVTPYVNNPPSLTVAHFDGTNWSSMGVAGLTSGASGSGTVTWGIPQSTLFGIFAIGSINFLNPLPVTINYFTGSKQNNRHVLDWKITCNSTPFADVEMERSTDGLNFKTVYNIHATAVRCQQPFTYTDDQPAAGINYYRLKMADANGKITYSSIVSLINAATGFEIVNIAPNPVVNGLVHLKISSAEKTQMEIVITDMEGRVLQKQAVNLAAGLNTILINTNKLPRGVYGLTGYTSALRSKVLRFVVQ